MCYSQEDVHPGYNGFNPEDARNSSNYAMYNLGGGNMGEYAIVGGIPDGTLAATHVGGVVSQPAVAVPYGTQMPSGLSGLAGQLQDDQHQHTYSSAEYDTRQGLSIGSEGVHE